MTSYSQDYAICAASPCAHKEKRRLSTGPRAYSWKSACTSGTRTPRSASSSRLILANTAGASAHTNMLTKSRMMPAMRNYTGCSISHPSASSFGSAKLTRSTNRNFPASIISALTYFQNLIETQSPKVGVTVFTDHLPAVGEQSLSNKGQLSAWKIHETAVLNSIV